MDCILNCSTQIIGNIDTAAVKCAAAALERDIVKRFTLKSGAALEEKQGGNIFLERVKENAEPEWEAEHFVIDVSEHITITAKDDLGFVYGLYFISEKFLGIEPFWFWLDQVIGKADKIVVPKGRYTAPKPIVRYRGWFVNDEVLIMKWKINGDSEEPWRMVFEALLRCGGNMVIPGTDKNSRKYGKLASDMGLWITHHHAEPLGAEMFVRAYPDVTPNYAETPELFIRLWEDAVKAQKDRKTVWCLGFRGQGDCPFWNSDTSGRFDTSQKRGRLISDVIKLQKQLVLKYVENPVFCTNLYGEIMELYEEGCLELDDDIIKVSADNGYGKMVTRRRDNHTARIASLPTAREKHGGIYYHVSFYDLQAANHITMLPNSVDFVDKELSEVIEKGAVDYWIINCSNVRPHVYFLDAVRKKWYGEPLSDDSHSMQFAEKYFGGNKEIAGLYRDYHKAMLPYGDEEDEHAGEQFYTENVRLLIHAAFNGKTEGTEGLLWLTGPAPLAKQVEKYTAMCRDNLDAIGGFYKRCIETERSLSGEVKRLFGATILLQASIHYYCTMGVVTFGDGFREYTDENWKAAFMQFGYSAEYFDKADLLMRDSEYGLWKGFYFNECFADIKHTAYMLKKLMGYVRERGDNARHDKWYRDAVYAKEDQKVMTLLVNDNHMTDWELFEAYKSRHYRN